MRRNNKTRFWRIATAVIVTLMSAGSHAAAAGQCNISGPRYRLASDNVDWSMRIERGQNCTLAFPLNTILSSSPGSVEIENVKLISSPQSGQVIIKNDGFQYAAEADFQGQDTFTVEVSGAINKVHGISTIHIAVSGVGVASTLALRPRPLTPSPLPRGLAPIGARKAPPISTAASNSDWSILKIGAGGFLRGMSISSDNTYVVSTDTYGAYLWSPSATAPNGSTGTWQQIVNVNSMPPIFRSNGQLFNSGIYELQIAYNNSSVMYMTYLTYATNTYPPKMGVYLSSNKGTTWTQTNFTPVGSSSGNGNAAGDLYRTWGPKIAIDPNTASTVYVGTPQNGLWYSINSGSSWTQVSADSVPNPGKDGSNNFPGFSGMVIDNGHNVYVYSYGNGVYEYNGSSWSHLTSGTGPTHVRFATIDYNTGCYYAVDSGSNLWVWNGSTWSKTITSGGSTETSVLAVAVDPNTSGHAVALTGSGNINETFDSGGSWSGFATGGPDNGVSLSSTGDIPWQTTVLNGGTYTNWAYFDRSTAKKIYTNGANNFYVNTPWFGNISKGTNVTWNSQGRGIEQLVANEIIVPTTGVPLAASWDRVVFLPSLSGAYPSTFYPIADGSVVAGWSIDYASSNPSFIAVLADGNYAGGPQRHSYSINGGTTWSAFSSAPAMTFGGNIAVSTPSNMIFAPANGNQPYYTTNFGTNTTWTGITLPGVSSWAHFMEAFFWPTRVICADRVNGNTFYLLFNGIGIFRSTNGGASWSRASSAISPGPPAQMKCTPGRAGDIWIATGSGGNAGGDQGAYGNLYHSTDGGATWTTIANVTEPYTIGFGAPKPGGSGYPVVFMVGWVSGTFGVWRTDDEGSTWNQLGEWPMNSLDQIRTISGDPEIYGQVYIGFAGSGYAFLRPSR
jgi:photosystem II stability/assembly factor-like uncharacterized protein